MPRLFLTAAYCIKIRQQFKYRTAAKYQKHTAERVCHKSTVGSSTDISMASAFSTPSAF